MPNDYVLSPEPPKRSSRTAPSPGSQPQPIPDGVVLSSALKTMELELQRRGILSSADGLDFHPLWFLAETERNVYLWRNGHSIIDQDLFEFWIDVNQLIEKRLSQLDKGDTQNPFVNPTWSIASFDHDALEREREYLIGFRTALQQISLHAEALSRVASQVLQEQGLQPSRKMVVLPAR